MCLSHSRKTYESKTEAIWLFNEFVDFNINHYIKFHIYKDFELLILKKSTSVTADDHSKIFDNSNDENNILKRYDGICFGKSCATFD